MAVLLVLNILGTFQFCLLIVVKVIVPTCRTLSYESILIPFNLHTSAPWKGKSALGPPPALLLRDPIFPSSACPPPAPPPTPRPPSTPGPRTHCPATPWVGSRQQPTGTPPGAHGPRPLSCHTRVTLHYLLFQNLSPGQSSASSSPSRLCSVRSAPVLPLWGHGPAGCPPLARWPAAQAPGWDPASCSEHRRPPSSRRSPTAASGCLLGDTAGPGDSTRKGAGPPGRLL